MIRLIQIETQKLWLNRASKILILVSFILPLTVILLSSISINLFSFLNIKMGEIGMFNFPMIWHVATFTVSLFKIFFAIVIVSMIGNEYSNKTIKQNLIDGLSKKEFLLSKFYTIVIFSIISTILIGITILFIGFYNTELTNFKIIFNESEFLFAYLIKQIGFFSLCLFFALLIRRSAFSLAFLFILYFVEWLFYGLLNRITNETIAEKIYNLFPLHSMYKLIDQPFQRVLLVKFPNNQEKLLDYTVYFHEIFIVLVWTTIFLFLSYFLLKKRDL
ncbi:ABC transporter permease subunit [Flavobacterium jejuense]|uniref:ABC transporter permease subunit n=1 Tax=Flavobacterium jejuense TaxID=1544455 RepID=A0ABX0IQZ7_9FLAO|nr:ABC transporter permease subunit [Flavobacterium jejuense]NHN25287.1 ABC transporter permease subunit [Flavobacterium jejuense]